MYHLLVDRKIPANSQIYKEFNKKYYYQIKQFKYYLDGINKKENGEESKSGKNDSYSRYLIRLIILYYEESNEYIEDINNFDSVKKIETVVNNSNFKELNKRENHFYSATFNCYKAYVAYKSKTSKVSIENTLDLIKPVDKNLSFTTFKKPIEIQTSITKYKRSSQEVLTAKKKSLWRCEYNPNHETFISETNQKPYVEAHHLIPMQVQSYYKQSIDFADNIVVLCPNCHRKIHNGLSKERKEMLEVLYYKREHVYRNHEIDLNLKELLLYYSIFD